MDRYERKGDEQRRILRGKSERRRIGSYAESGQQRKRFTGVDSLFVAGGSTKKDFGKPDGHSSSDCQKRKAGNAWISAGGVEELEIEQISKKCKVYRKNCILYQAFRNFKFSGIITWKFSCTICLIYSKIYCWFL